MKNLNGNFAPMHRGWRGPIILAHVLALAVFFDHRPGAIASAILFGLWTTACIAYQLILADRHQ